MPISEILRKIRLLRGYKLEYVASYLGISTEAYRRKETGQNDPQYGTLLKIAELYKITIYELISFDIDSIMQKQSSSIDK